MIRRQGWEGRLFVMKHFIFILCRWVGLLWLLACLMIFYISVLLSRLSKLHIGRASHHSQPATTIIIGHVGKSVTPRCQLRMKLHKITWYERHASIHFWDYFSLLSRPCPGFAASSSIRLHKRGMPQLAQNVMLSLSLSTAKKVNGDNMSERLFYRYSRQASRQNDFVIMVSFEWSSAIARSRCQHAQMILILCERSRRAKKPAAAGFSICYVRES